MLNRKYLALVFIISFIKIATSFASENSFCVDPAKYICKSREASILIEKANASAKLFEKYVIESEQNTPQVQKILEQLKVNSCDDVNWRKHNKEKMECDSARKPYLFSLIYTPKRIHEADAQIRKAKQVMAMYLNHIKLLRTDKNGDWKNNSEAKWYHQSMKQVVNFNPAYSYTQPSSSSFSFNFSPTELMGMILYVDEVPNMLFFAALHEIGHLLYPTESLNEESDFPWKDLVRCQQRADTASWHLQDMKCSQIGSHAVIQNKSKGYDFFKPVAEKCLKNDVVNCLALSQTLPATVSCAKDQSIEGMADWFTSSAFALLVQNEDKLKALFSESAKMLVVEFTSLQCSFSDLPKYSDTTTSKNLNTHPMPLDRVNTILTDPIFKNLFGCFNENAPIIKSLNQPVDPNGLKYFCDLKNESK